MKKHSPRTRSLLQDFPELNNPETRNQIVAQICERAGLPRPMVDDQADSQAFAVRIDAEKVILGCLPNLYRNLVLASGRYDKHEVFEKAVSTQVDVLVYVDKNMWEAARMVLNKAINLAFHKDEDRGLSLKTVRKIIETMDRIRLKPGRKPVKASVRREIIQVHKTLMGLLAPGFDKKGTGQKWKALVTLSNGVMSASIRTHWMPRQLQVTNSKLRKHHHQRRAARPR